MQASYSAGHTVAITLAVARSAGESVFCFFFFSPFSFRDATRQESIRCEVVEATALGRLAVQPDRPIALWLSPSAILPLPKHKEAANRATAETNDRRRLAAVSTPIRSTCVLRLRSFVGAGRCPNFRYGVL